MVFVGYAATLGYLAFIILFFGFVNKKFKVDVEITRKILHILIGFTWVLMDIFWSLSYHQIIMCALFVVVNALSRKYKLFSGIERNNDNHPGTVYYALAMLVLSIASYCYEPLYIPFGMAVMCLSFGDGLAPIFSIIFRKHNRKLVYNKTLAGTIACFIFTSVALIVFKVCYKIDISYLSLIAIASVVAIIELYCQWGLDNFGITFSAALLSLWAINVPLSVPLQVCILLSFVIMLAILLTNSLTASGAFLAYIMLIVSSYCVGVVGFLIYVIPFILIAAAGKIKRNILSKRGVNIVKKGRNAIQVAINGLLTLILMVVYKITSIQSLFVLSAISLAEAFADSMASDIGSLIRHEPYDIFRHKRVPSGVSGGMSVLGTLVALLSCIVVGVIAYFETKNILSLAFITGIGFLGTIIDSFIGSLFQALYRCRICGELTEKRIHHRHPTELIKGNKFITNNAVNLISNILTIAIGCLWFIV